MRLGETQSEAPHVIRKLTKVSLKYKDLIFRHLYRPLKNHWYRRVFNGFYTVEPLPLNEWFCCSPLASRVFNGFGKSERWPPMLQKSANHNTTEMVTNRIKLTADTPIQPYE